MAQEHELTDRVAVIVGGSGEIGAATARRLARLGASVVLTYHKQRDAAERIIRELDGERHFAVPADVGEAPSLAELGAFVSERCGRADILVNAAGFTRSIAHRDLDALDDAFIDRMFQVNWRGSFGAIRTLAPLLKASGDGLIVNISSIAGTTGIGSNIAYCAVKAGIDVMTRSLARALAPDIRVMAVSPGVVDTDFVPGRDADFNERVAKTIPLRRIATADDVADAILACATHLRYSTGAIITVDGGRSL